MQIDYILCEIKIEYWPDGMTAYDGNIQVIKLYPDEIKDLTLDEFDRLIYKYVEDDFKNLVQRLQEYKDGKFDVLEKASNKVRILDVM